MGFVSFYKKPQPRGYANKQYYIEDSSANSPDYFQITQFPDITGGGKYVIKLKGNGLNLRTNSTIDIEIIDADGNNIFTEVVDFTDRFNDYYITLEVYDITARGIATAYIVGEAAVDPSGNSIPPSQQGQYNIRWQRNLTILPFERNVADLIFDEPPKISISQVTTPEKSFVAAEGLDTTIYSVYTSSIDDYTIVTSNFKGYDRDFASSKNILDTRLQGLLLNPLQAPTTTNSVNSSLRADTNDIQNGYIRDISNRFNTVVKSKLGSIQKDFLGGTFEFNSEDDTPTTLSPAPPSNYTVSGSNSSQLKSFQANIIEVMTDTDMRITKPLEIVVLDSNTKTRGYTTKYTYKQASNFTGSITYLPSDAAFVTSSTVSQSYLETTFSDLKPISGQVYRIKTYYKRGISSGEYKLIHDHVTNPVEYLTDATFPNQTTYAARESDYRLIGHFTEQTIAQDYWEYLVETPGAIYPGIIPTINSSSLHESIPIQADYTHSGLFTTQNNQNYDTNQTYTLSFNVAMDANTELEVYANSDPLNTNTLVPQAYTRAFIKDPNTERTRYSTGQNRFGKFVGRIKNDRNIDKYYGKVEFDFVTDASGLGRPVFRAKTIDYADTIGNVYVGEVSIKPLAINGFTPNLVQYAIPFNNEIDAVLSVSQSLDFKLEYFDYTGKQSEYVTYLNDLKVNIKTEIPTNGCQAEITNFLIQGPTEI
tara:strand:+ start:3842 stop:5959 length:2118 start_codon:yes stop_codon:yes gene_type:complete